MLATGYQFIVVAGLFLGIAATLRQRYAPMTSIIGAFVGTGLAAFLQVGHGSTLGMMHPELVILAAFTWLAALTLQEHPRRSTVFVTCVALGAVAGLQLLVKFNTGLTVLMVAVAGSVLLGWRAWMRHCATAAAFAVSAVTWWLAAGQRLGDLPAWLKYSGAILSGYGEAQAEPLTPNARPAMLLALVWIVMLCVMFVHGGPAIPRNLVLLAGLLTAITVKTAFARYDIWHFSALLGVIAVTTAIVPSVRLHHRIYVLLVVALAFYVVAGTPLEGRLWPPNKVFLSGADRVVGLALPGHVEQRIQRAKAGQRAAYDVPNRIIEAIGSKTVHVDPYQTSVVWAYDLAWRPAPMFATYSAYTPELDKLNADTLADGPDFVLSRVSGTSPAIGIDNRLAVQESPLYSRALLCDFTLTGVENHWALFTRFRTGAVGRCRRLRAAGGPSRSRRPAPRVWRSWWGSILIRRSSIGSFREKSSRWKPSPRYSTGSATA
ncbi:hypothetical protein [Mycobacterium sp.]|uniref:hypothetical protein n=1 Tax=Mycobacterium sp. TaxID=1785 RepID=UPI003A865EFC